MKTLQWVKVDMVGGVADWGERTNLTVGAKVIRPFRHKDGTRGEREETVIEIQRHDNGVHVVITKADLPEPEEI